MSDLYGVIGGLGRALDYHLNRQTVLSSNLANVDTPGFRAAELVRAEPGPSGGALRMTATSEAHIPHGADGSGDEYVRLEDRVSPPGADGNSVDLDWEMSKLQANNLRYDTVAKMVARQLGVLRYASNGGSG